MVERNGWSRYEEAWDIASFSFLYLLLLRSPRVANKGPLHSIQLNISPKTAPLFNVL